MTSWHEVITRNGSKTGILKKCASDPCYLHNGSDFSISSDNPADAYAYYYQHSPAAFTPGMMGKAVQTAQIKGYAAKKQLRNASGNPFAGRNGKCVRQSAGRRNV